MAVTEKQFYERFFLAYKRKDFGFLKSELANLPEHIRFEILTKAVLDEEHSLLTEENFKFLASNINKCDGMSRLNLIKKAFLCGFEELITHENITFLNNNWRRLGGKDRLDIIRKSSEIDNKLFCGEQHFLDWENDLALVEEELSRLKEKFGLTAETCKQICSRIPVGKKGKSYITETVALYCRLGMYEELFDKYDITEEYNPRNYEIFCCPLSRTETRIKFLFNVLGKNAKKDLFFFEDLKEYKEDFGVLYQKEILDKLDEWKKKDPEAYHIIRKYCEFKPGITYFTFLEFGLSAFYGDEVLNKYVEEKRGKIKEKKPENQESSIGYTLEDVVKFVNKQSGIQVSKDDSQDYECICDDVVLPAGTKEYDTDRFIDTFIDRKAKGRGFEPLNEKRINEFIKALESKGFSCKGYVKSGSGMPCVDQEHVRLYFLEKDGVKILEPIGQLNNRTLIILDKDKTMEEIIEDLRHNTVSDLWSKGLLGRKNHDWGEQGYNYEFTEKLLENVVEKEKNKRIVAKEGKKRGGSKKKITEISDELVQITPREEIPEALDYVKEISEKTDTNLMQLAENSKDEIEEVRAITTNKENKDGKDDQNTGEVEDEQKGDEI